MRESREQQATESRISFVPVFHRDPRVFAFFISQREQREASVKSSKDVWEGRRSGEARKLKNQCLFRYFASREESFTFVPWHGNKSGINLLKAFSQIQTSPRGNFVTRRIEYAILSGTGGAVFSGVASRK